MKDDEADFGDELDDIRSILSDLEEELDEVESDKESDEDEDDDNHHSKHSSKHKHHKHSLVELGPDAEGNFSNLDEAAETSLPEEQSKVRRTPGYGGGRGPGEEQYPSNVTNATNIGPASSGGVLFLAEDAPFLATLATGALTTGLIAGLIVIAMREWKKHEHTGSKCDDHTHSSFQEGYGSTSESNSV